MSMMREHRIAALPVVKDDRLLGIITERDLMNMTSQLLYEQLERMTERSPSE